MKEILKVIDKHISRYIDAGHKDTVLKLKQLRKDIVEVEDQRTTDKLATLQHQIDTLQKEGNLLLEHAKGLQKDVDHIKSKRLFEYSYSQYINEGD